MAARRTRATLAALALALVASPALTACAEDADAGLAVDVAAVVLADPAEAERAIEDGAVVIDVRTPEEFGAGHLEGALNLDVSDTAGFDAAIDELDRGATYVLYCRTGNRSAAAAERMADAGFRDVRDAGAFDDLAAAGLPTS